MSTDNRIKNLEDHVAFSSREINEDVTEADYNIFLKIVSADLSPVQKNLIVSPELVLPQQEALLAIHWHPENIPMELIKKRIGLMYPKKRNELIIPTQHNIMTSYNGYTGVEVDAFSKGFNQKVQLLLHFKSERVEEAGVLKQMLSHTFKYRSTQFYDFLNTVTKPDEDRLEAAARETGAGDSLIRFVRVYAKKLEAMLDKYSDIVPPEMIKNKLLRNLFNELRDEHGDNLIDRVQTFLAAVKKIVKKNFPTQYFYRTSEIIEEARSLGAGIVIPHPEQFWPILLADYDVDGVEVWNPQSQRYTEFLVSALHSKNLIRTSSRKRLIFFMGDDTHMGEKIIPFTQQNGEKASREIGYQPAWDDMDIKKALILADMDRESVINEYRDRLGS